MKRQKTPPSVLQRFVSEHELPERCSVSSVPILRFFLTFDEHSYFKNSYFKRFPSIFNHVCFFLAGQLVIFSRATAFLLVDVIAKRFQWKHFVCLSLCFEALEASFACACLGPYRA